MGPELSGKVIGAALAVHRALGPGFLESAYEKALCVELGLRGIPFARQVPIPVTYRGVAVAEHRLDLVVRRSLVVELKHVEAFHPAHQATLHSYLRATDLPLGLLLNFAMPTLEIKRVINSHRPR